MRRHLTTIVISVLILLSSAAMSYGCEFPTFTLISRTTWEPILNCDGFIYDPILRTYTVVQGKGRPVVFFTIDEVMVTSPDGEFEVEDNRLVFYSTSAMTNVKGDMIRIQVSMPFHASQHVYRADAAIMNAIGVSLGYEDGPQGIDGWLSNHPEYIIR